MNEKDLPNWAACVKKLLLVQPSSERVFSLLNASFRKQDALLQDYLEASLMLQYNRK